MLTREMIVIALDDAVWSNHQEAMYLDQVEKPMPGRAPKMLIT
jgi:hypothetical protein